MQKHEIGTTDGVHQADDAPTVLLRARPTTSAATAATATAQKPTNTDNGGCSWILPAKERRLDTELARRSVTSFLATGSREE